MPGLLEILIIVALALLLFGCNRLPVLGKSLGKGVGEFGKSFKNAANLTDLSPGLEDEGTGKQSDGERR